MCNLLVSSGMNLYNIESFIIERKWAAYARNYNRFKFYTGSTHTCTLTGFQHSHLSSIPSNSVLTQRFLSSISGQEHLYLREMSSIIVRNAISFDHTFKIASNIGYYREDKVWIKQYNSLFLVMNSNGQVVTWQLTSGTAIDQVDTVLVNAVNSKNRQLITST